MNSPAMSRRRQTYRKKKWQQELQRHKKKKGLLQVRQSFFVDIFIISGEPPDEGIIVR